MDQLDVNLTELRNALVNPRRRNTPVLITDEPVPAGESVLDAVVASEAQPGAFAAEHMRARSWFKRLFGG